MLKSIGGLVVCGSPAGLLRRGPAGPKRDHGVTWKLESVERDGRPAVAVPDPDRYTLQLDPNGRLSVRADCNTCGGAYTLNDTSLTIGNALACTRAFCGTASLDTDVTWPR